MTVCIIIDPDTIKLHIITLLQYHNILYIKYKCDYKSHYIVFLFLLLFSTLNHLFPCHFTVVTLSFNVLYFVRWLELSFFNLFLQSLLLFIDIFFLTFFYYVRWCTVGLRVMQFQSSICAVYMEKLTLKLTLTFVFPYTLQYLHLDTYCILLKLDLRNSWHCLN